MSKLFKGVKAVAAAGNPTIYIYDEIGPAWAGMVGAETVLEALRQVGDADEIDVRINSPGGSVFEGATVYNTLIDHPAKINVKIDGLAASAASFIAMAGDSIEIAANAMVMIHRASTIAWGNVDEMRSTAELLEKIDGNLVGMYVARTGQKDSQIQSWMDAETWFTADEAVKHGFADTKKAAAKNVAIKVPAGRFKNAPEKIETYEPKTAQVTLATPPERPERQPGSPAGRGHSAAYVAARVAGMRSRIGF